jgi:hypothetical protein
MTQDHCDFVLESLAIDAPFSCWFDSQRESRMTIYKHTSCLAGMCFAGEIEVKIGPIAV